jgi:hypothetical protein
MMQTNSKPGWALIAITFVLLLAFGKLDLLVILLPISLLLGYAAVRFDGRKTGFSAGLKRGRLELRP